MKSGGDGKEWEGEWERVHACVGARERGMDEMYGGGKSYADV